MNPFSYLKRGAYHARVWLADVFRYPGWDGKLHGDYEEYWDERRGAALGGISDWQKDRANMVLRELRKEAPESISDIGSGAGETLRYLKERIPGLHTAAYDISPRALEAARKNGVDEAVPLDTRDAEALGKLKPADYFLFFEVLEHMPSAEELLRTGYEKAGKGVFFSVPNTGFISHRLRLFFGSVPLQWAVSPNEHVRFWTVRDLRWWLTAQRYVHAKILPYRGIPFLNKLMPNLFAEGAVVFIPKA